ncbi:MAG: hypothetical protein KAS39_05530 [Actinomycetia bacterium]|nr:hypothetical protein [Actinomycetes bacterium]
MKRLILIILLVTMGAYLSAVPAISIKIVENQEEKQEDSTVSVNPTGDNAAVNDGDSTTTVSVTTNASGTIIIHNTININTKNNNVNNNVVSSEEEESVSGGASSPSGSGGALDNALDINRKVEKFEEKNSLKKYRKLKISPGRIIWGQILGVMLPGSGIAHYMTGGIAGGILTNIFATTGLLGIVGSRYAWNNGKITSLKTYQGLLAGSVIMFLSAYLFDVIGAPIRVVRYHKKLKRGLDLTALKRVNLEVAPERYAMSFNYKF